jgi:hypothetical protein
VTPWVLVVLLAGLVLGWVGRSVRAAGREWNLRCELADAEVEAAAATFAWKLEKDRNDKEWDDGWLYAARIDSREGEL